MLLLVETINTEIKTLHKNNIRLKTIGNIDGLPEIGKKHVAQNWDNKDNSGMTLILASTIADIAKLFQWLKSNAERLNPGEVLWIKLDAAMVEEHLYTRHTFSRVVD